MALSRISSTVPDEPSVINPGRARSARSKSRQRARKRLILCEDGSWLSSQGTSLKNSITVPSNVTRISRAIRPLSRDGIAQVVYYHWGVGAGGGVVAKLAGISGGGLPEIVREGYEFLATNYIPGDEIFIFGFSRGAYTARSIAGLIDQIGLLTNEGLPFLPEIFRDVQHKHERDYRPRHPNIPFPDKPSASSPEYRSELRRRGMTILDIPIKVVGVWETVGALGVPKIGWLTRLGLQSTTMKDLSFYNTALSDCIEFAFQALALDERRFSFQPTLWEKRSGNTTVLRQVWFPGAHANVGGSYDDQQMATITLAWMMAQCEEFLDFDRDYLLDQWEEAEDYYSKKEERVRPWAFGKIWNGLQDGYALGGSKVRTPGRYCAVDPDTGQLTNYPLLNTHEYIHPSVRTRIKLKGPGLQDRGIYECQSLQEWKLVIEWPEGSKRPSIYWRSRDRPESGFVRKLPEAPLWALELELLQYDPDTEQYVMKPSGMKRRSQRRGDSRAPSRAHSRTPSREPSRNVSRSSRNY